MEDLIVGIKLSGSSFCVGVFMNNNIKIFENYDGQRVTPCFVFFTKNGEKVVGKLAEEMAITEPEQGIFGFERLVGNDIRTRNSSIPIPFKVKSNNNNLEVVIQQTNNILNVTPKELYTICFKKVKKDAEDKLGVTINKSVFALPTYFNAKQREVVLAAAKDSGFTVLKVVNQPTAAALCYEYHAKDAKDCSEKSHHSVVFHLGGSSCEVALIKTNSTNIEEVYFESDTSMGGQDFDCILMNYVCNELQTKHNYDPRSTKSSIRSVLKQCQEAKKTLSFHKETLINLEDNSSMEIEVTRDKLEELCHNLFQKAVNFLSKCLKTSGIKKVKNIILIGGSTRIPKIGELLSSTFNCQVLKTVKPEECVVTGATILAAMMSEKDKQKIRKINLREIALSKSHDSELDIPVANLTIHEEAKLAKFALPARESAIDQYPLTTNNFEKSELVVGIEINDTNICVGLYSNGTAKVLEIMEGSKTIPCRLFFSDTGKIYFGKCDKPLTVQPNHIIYNVDRLIGRKFSDHDLQEELKSLPFTVQDNKNGEPTVVIKQNNKIQRLSPRKLYTIIFEKLKKAIESELEKTISKIVLTVPLSFSETQKKVILSAARNASFEILKLTNTPVAAGLYHYFEKNLGHSYSMVCNLQSTFEVAILEGTSTAIQKIGLTSEPKLGSKYFDNLLVKYVCDEVKKLYGCDPKTDKANLEKLNSVCANAKKALLYANETFVNLDGLFNVTYPIRLNLTKEKFEQACSHLFNRISELVKSFTENTNIPSSVIEEVILVGDSYFPKIKKIISDYLPQVLYQNGDDYVIKGIAVLGALSSKHPEQKVRNIHLVKDSALSLQASLPNTVDDFESDSDQETENFNPNNEGLSNIAIGIDLGTTNSCVCVYLDGKTIVLENSDQEKITPSFLFFSQMKTFVGTHAKRRANNFPKQGIYEVKRLLGRQFNDPHLQAKLKFLPFNVQVNGNGDPVIIIDDGKRVIRKSPKEICTILLQRLKTDVQNHFGTIISKAVITVPAYFNVKQREATLEAAKDAGFTVLKLLNEPTAAALCYFSETECYGSSYSMIYDLGGGTFDVAILKRTRENIEIISVDGDTELGGQDFDNLIMDHICNKIKQKYLQDPRNTKYNLRRLHIKCEEAKKVLSSITETSVTLYGFLNEHPVIDILLTRQELEELCFSLFDKTIAIVTNCIKSSGISKSSIDKVILCGGSTRIPKIQEMLSNYFNGKTLSKYIHPDECVAEGAAVQAAMLSKHPRQKIQQIRLSDVLPLSLGSATLGNKMNFLIKRNSTIPTQATMTYATMHDQETFINIEIYEGERADVRKNRFLGKMQISNITPAPPAHCQVNLTLSVDENGIITATAKEKFQENVKELKLDYSRGARNEHEVKNAVLDAENYKEEDERFVRFVDQKIYLMRYCTSIAFNLNEKDLADKYETTYDLCEEFYTLAQDMEVDQEEELLNMLQEIKILCEPLVKEYDFKLTV